AILAYPRDATSKAYWADKIDVHRAGLARGADVHPQVTCRPISFRFTMEDPTVFAMVPSFAEALGTDHAGRIRLYRDPGWRARARDEIHNGGFVDARFDTFSVAETRDARLVDAPVTKLAVER